MKSGVECAPLPYEIRLLGFYPWDFLKNASAPMLRNFLKNASAPMLPRLNIGELKDTGDIEFGHLLHGYPTRPLRMTRSVCLPEVTWCKRAHTVLFTANAADRQSRHRVTDVIVILFVLLD